MSTLALPKRPVICDPGKLLTLPMSPLSLNQLTRDLWGSFDAAAIAQLAGLAEDDCYQIKFYKAPADNQELFAGYGYVPYGMRVTPGDLLFGIALPVMVQEEDPYIAPPFTVQIRDESLQHDWFDDPLASYFLANYKPEYQSNFNLYTGSFWNLFDVPYPVVGSGLFMVEIQSTSPDPQRIELVFGALEVCQSDR
jgi:hypothetical protein